MHLGLALLLSSLVLVTTRMLGLPQADVALRRPRPAPGQGPISQHRGRAARRQERRARPTTSSSNSATTTKRRPAGAAGGGAAARRLLAARRASTTFGKPRSASTTAGALVPRHALRRRPRHRARLRRRTDASCRPCPTSAATASTLETTVAMLADHNRPFALESPVELEPRANPDPGRFRRTYRVISEALDGRLRDSLLGQRRRRSELEPRSSARTTCEAPSDPRYAELAQQIVAEMPQRPARGPVARATDGYAVARPARASTACAAATREAEDPTADFLFGDRTGYCVHFAHAARLPDARARRPARVGVGLRRSTSRRGRAARRSCSRAPTRTRGPRST